MRFLLCLILLAVQFTATTAHAQAKKEISLKMGSAAPPLQADKWVKGTPITEFEKGKVYVLEFWATWCGPCKAAIPHVTELQKKYRDQGLSVIGMNIWERDVKLVEPFVEEMGDKMDYSVATDVVLGESKGAMAETWMQAAGRNGIPSSFIVNQDGVIAWIGHPMQMDEPLEQIIEGTYDIQKEIEKAEKLEKLTAELATYKKSNEHEQALETLKAIGEVTGKPEALQGEVLAILIKKGDPQEIEAQIAAMEEAAKDDPIKLTRLGSTLANNRGAGNAERAMIILQKASEKEGSHKRLALATIARLLERRGDLDGAIRVITEAAVADGNADSAQPQVLGLLIKKGDFPAVNKMLDEVGTWSEKRKSDVLSVANILAMNTRSSEINREQALKIAEKAVELAGPKNMNAKRALAAVLAGQGEHARAIEIQTEVAAAGKGIVKSMDEARLKKYQEAAEAAGAGKADAAKEEAPKEEVKSE